MKISGKIRAVEVGDSLYARENAGGENFWKISGQCG